MRKISICGGLAGLLLLNLPACSPAPGGADAPNTSEAADAAAANAVAPAPEPAGPGAAAAPLVLEGAGLRLAGGSPPATLPFDTPQAATIAALTRAFGRPPTERGANEECGGGGLDYATWDDEIIVWFDSGRFIGWDNKGKLRTAGGLGLGSSRRDLARLQGLEVEESTLGTEFSAAGLGGILESKDPDARVTHLWGGSTCVFR